jgi:hypothetical protein
MVSGVVAVGCGRRISARTYREFCGVMVQPTVPEAWAGKVVEKRRP